MTTGNAYSSYKKQSVTTMTNMDIVVRLYDECERQMNRALFFIGSKDFENTNNALMKAVDIVSALRSVLDLEIDVGRNLDSLYVFFTQELIEANMKKDADKINSLLPLISDLKDAFVQISKMPKEQINIQAIQNTAQGGAAAM